MDTHGLDWMGWCCAFLRHAFYVLKEITDDPVSIEHSLFVLVMCRREMAIQNFEYNYIVT